METEAEDEEDEHIEESVESKENQVHEGEEEKEVKKDDKEEKAVEERYQVCTTAFLLFWRFNTFQPSKASCKPTFLTTVLCTTEEIGHRKRKLSPKTARADSAPSESLAKRHKV